MSRTSIVAVVVLLAACAGQAAAPPAATPEDPPPPGMKVYRPENPAPRPPGQKVSVQHIQLLSTEAEIGAATNVDAMVAFINNVHRLGEETLSASPHAFQLGVEFDCAPGEVRFRFLHDKQPGPTDLLAAYEARLQTTDHLPVSQGHVRFIVVLQIQP